VLVYLSHCSSSTWQENKNPAYDRRLIEIDLDQIAAISGIPADSRRVWINLFLADYMPEFLIVGARPEHCVEIYNVRIGAELANCRAARPDGGCIRRVLGFDESFLFRGVCGDTTDGDEG